MSALLSCQGDIAARHMLKNALVGRYGSSPTPLENVIVDFQGHIFDSTSGSNAPTLADATAMFEFPRAMRWDFVTRSGHSSLQTSESYDGRFLYHKVAGRQNEIITDIDLLQGTIRRFWAMGALFITPLAAANIQVKAVDWTRFYFREAQLGSQVLVRIDKRFRIECIQTYCHNPATGQREVYSIVPSTDVVKIDGLNFPGGIQTYWGDRINMSLKPVAITVDVPVPATMFQLTYETNRNVTSEI